MKTPIKWHQETRLITDLKVFEHNPRRIGGKGYDDLKESIDRFGLAEPIIVNLDDTVIGGHARLLAQKERGETKVDVNVPDRLLTLPEVKELNIRLNKNIGGEWDWDVMANNFEVDDLLSWGFEEDELGFDPFPTDDKDEKVPSIPDTPITQVGDIYELGPHRVMCGDSTNLEQVKKLMNFGVADMIFTDPPYNVNYSGRGKKTSRTIENDNMEAQEFRNFLNAVFVNYQAISVDGTAWYVCYASRTHREFEDAINLSGYNVVSQIIWVKGVASMGWGNYRWKHEPILYCKPLKGSVKFYGNRKQYTTWDHKPTNEELLRVAREMLLEDDTDPTTTVWKLNRESNYDHPTQKPIQLIIKALLNSSKTGDRVVDLFAGSGSTLIACEKTGRVCSTMEVDPRFVDVVVQRYVDYTGNEEIIKNGKKVRWQKTIQT